MRLTLRTLLAYLNDVLTPEEAEQLKHRIEESEFASTLVQRIRHVLRRLRLSAPKVEGRGVGFDPNSVAEYLDSTMPPESVVDFEKVCLESDVHLAEVAAGYEILAKVLNEHAEVPTELRNRIYGLKDRVGKAAVAAPSLPHSDNGKAAAAALGAAHRTPPPPPVSTTRRQPPQVPDYLKPEPKSPSNAWLLLPVTLLALLGIAFFVPPLNQYNPLVKRSPDLAEKPPEPENANGSQPNPVAPPDHGENTEGEQSPSRTNDAADTPPVIAAVDNGKQDATEKTDKENADEENAPKPIEPDKAVADSGDKPAPEPPPEPKPPETSTDKPEVKPAVSPEPSTGVELGRFISDETLLASFNFKNRLWMRVPPRALITEGEQCVSLPIYRPQVGLSSGVIVTLVGEGSVLFTRQADRDQTQVAVDYGRILIHSNALQKAQTNLSFNGVDGVLALESPDSMAAVEFYSFLPPGSDPMADDMKSDRQLILNLIGVTGECTWTQKGLEPISIPDHSVQIVIDGKPARKRTRVQLPAWIDAANTDRLDRDSAKIVEPLLALDRPLTVALEELLTHRRLDVRVHVARCLAFLGQFEPLIKQLNEEQYKSYWMRADGHIDTLRKQLARGESVAKAIQADMIEARGEKDGMLMFRLLQGFNNQQLINGDEASPTAIGFDEQLVSLLAHPSLDIRVLAIDNLNRITGSRHLYNPVQMPDKSKSRIKAWQEVLDKGGIRYAAEPNPLPEFRSLEIKSDEPVEKTKGKGK